MVQPGVQMLSKMNSEGVQQQSRETPRWINKSQRLADIRFGSETAKRARNVWDLTVQLAVAFSPQSFGDQFSTL